MNGWRIAEVAQLENTTRIEQDGSFYISWKCKLCGAHSLDSQKVEHAEYCPVEILRKEEDQKVITLCGDDSYTGGRGL